MRNRKKIFCFDIDGVICNTKKKDYLKSKPNKKVIKIINQIYINHKVIIFTARYMGRNKENISVAKKQGYKKTYNQLIKWGLKFDELRLGKPTFDVYVDDKNFLFKNDWYKEFSKKYLK